ncbi:MAG: CaiB/BaiF CoA transferase family protein [Polaromonas sp.]
MSVLKGIRVVDLTRVVAGPWATQTLADLGADVIKIERPGNGEDTRRIGPFLTGADGQLTNDSAFFMGVNRGKRSVTIDIADERGAAMVRELARDAQVFVENHKVGSLNRFGLDYESIRQINPSIVYCSVTGFGQDGPYAVRPAYDSILQALCGLMSTCGSPDGEPTRSGIPITDIVAGLYATIAIQAALMHREHTGEGQYIDCAMIDTTVAINGHLALGFLMSGKSPRRQGNNNPIAAPSEVFPASDGHFILGVGNDSQYRAFTAVIEQPELALQERFASNASRIRHRKELRELIERVTLTRPVAHWVDRLAAANVPAGPINDMRQLFEDAQVQHRDLSLRVPHASGVSAPTLRSPLRMSGMAVEHRAAPALGQHTAEVLGGLLGHDEASMARLSAAGVI